MIALQRLQPTLSLATVHVFYFVTLVTNLRKKALAHVQGNLFSLDAFFYLGNLWEMIYWSYEVLSN